MSSTTCTSLPQLEKVHTIAGTTQRSTEQVPRLQHHVRWVHYCNTVQENSPVVCFTESSGERRLSGVECSGVSDNAATDGGGGGVRAQTTLAEASVGEGSVTGATSGGGRDAQSLYNDAMAEERLVGGAALRTVLLYNGWRCCCL